MLKSFDSAVVSVRDFDAGVEHYGVLLGREPAWVGRREADGARSARFPLANMTLEIRGPASDGAATGSGAKEATEGLHCIVLELESADDPRGLLAERGLAIESETRHRAVDSEGESACEWTGFDLAPAATRGIGVELVAEVSGRVDGKSELVAPPEATIRDLDHVVVLSADLDATCRVYGETFGIRLALDRTFEARGVRLVFFRLGHVTIETGGRLGASPQPDSVDRFGGLAWEVVDIDAIQARLAGAGFDVSDVRVGHKPGTRVCTVRSPVHEVPTLLIEPAARS